MVKQAITACLRLLAIAALVSGCATGGAKFRPESVKAGAGLIYVYMPTHLFLNNVKGMLVLRMDGKKIGNVGPGIYYPIQAPPGLRTVSLDSGLLLDHSVKLPVAAGKTYYVRLSMISHTPTVHSIVPERVTREIGNQEIRDAHRG